MDFASHFARALSYDSFLEQYGAEEHRRRWAEMHARIRLTEPQKVLLQSFQREMKVLVMAGAWCGDCVDQCPIFDHFARVNEKIRVRLVDRDDCGELEEELSICGGARVPAVLFLSEDCYPVGRYGDRTLSKYRHMAAEKIGEACSVGFVPQDHTLLDAVVQDWLDEFERIQLILRTSPRLRKKHGD